MSTTNESIQIATAARRRGFTVTSVRVHTPDGRAWSIDAVAGGGYRLFELNAEDERAAEEHDAVEGDTWAASDLIDYLAAVGGTARPR